MKQTLFLFLLITCSLCTAQESVKTELKVDITTMSIQDSTMYPFKIKVYETLNFENYAKDSVHLTLENLAIPCNLFHQNVHIVTLGEDNGKIKELDYSFNYQDLEFALPSPSCKIMVEYDFQSDMMFRLHHIGIRYASPNLYEWQSWYFVCDNMEIKKVEMNAPKEFYFFSNLPDKICGLSHELCADSIKANNISFYLFNKEYYNHSSFSNDSVLVDVYQTKGIVVNADSTDYIPYKNDTILFARRVEDLKHMINKIRDLLVFDSSLHLSIVDANLVMRGGGVWGQTVSCSADETLILIDTTAWNDNSLTHELLHALDKNLLSSISREDSAYYFFSESLVEYLSVYLKYDDPVRRDAEFSEKMLGYTLHKMKSSKVLGLKDNHMDLGNKTGSGYIIYEKTPFVIHRFAKKIGEDRFIAIFRDFYHQAKAKHKVSLADFERVMKSHGVTDYEWIWFMWYL